MINTFRTFQSLHVPGDPLILYNAWDVGSALAVADAGAKAIATGSLSVAAAQGYDDGEAMPLDLALASATRIAGAVMLPVTIDFEGGYAVDAEAVGENIARLAATGAIGCNFEDQVVGGEGLYPVKTQAARIAGARAAVGDNFFINARTDVFLQAPRETHDETMVEAAITRAQAYEAAGASGMFAAGLADLALVEMLCSGTDLPVNLIPLPGGPDVAALAAAGVARISYGPHPYRAMLKRVEEAAQVAFAWR